MDEMPIWMLAQEILTKIKNELVLEAIDLLHKEIKENRVEINGQTIKLPDKSTEFETDMFIIKQLIEKENEIISTYSEFIRKFDVESKNSAQFVERIEELRKFLMSVSSIKILMNFSKTVDLWILDFA